MSAHHPIPGGTGADRSSADSHRPLRYEIRVAGHLGTTWTAWFDGFDITNEPDGSCVICGPVADQAALHGLLNKVRDIGLRLESLTQIISDLDPTDHITPGAPS